VVHVIDAVLIPSALPSTVVDIVVESEDHTTLEAAVVAAGLVETLQGDGPFTVFAPTDAAFAALPEGTVEALLADIPALTDILTYHVVGGKTMSSDLSDGQKIITVQGKKITVTINEDGVFIDNAKVTVADIEADNGVVHVIDAVLIPSALPSTVVDIVVDSEDHTTLEAAVVAAGLVETLQGDGPFTVFAPADAAFAALPEGTVEALLADIPALTDILTYHVVGAKAMSSDLSDGQKIITVQGKKITVTINEEGVFIDNAKVTVADIEADNGVVHVIDAVLIPSSLPSTVVDIVVESEDHTTLEAAVVAAGLVETLQGDGPFTVFAPTDAAFAALPEGTVEALLADIPALTDILTYHVVGAKAMSSDLSDGQKIITVQGKKITVTINEDGVFIDNAKVTVADIEADNGVVHVIDAVLIPSALPSTVVDIVVNSEDHTTLEAVVVAAGLVETLQGDGPFTVFAPTDAAFAALPAGTVEALLADIPALTNILTYHVVGGEAMSTDLSDGQKIITVQGKKITVTINDDGVFIDNAKVTVADIEADNGVVHVIDAVLIPSELPSTVVDIVVNSEDHTTLEAAVVAAGLVETLQGDGPFTVFAPTDAAFAALPEGTVEALLADIPALTDILTYHVVGGKAMSTDLSDGQMIATVNGKEIEITISEEGVFINNAKVTVANIEADNGVVHVIDAVLLPPTITVVDIVVNSEDHTTLEAAIVAAGLVETLQGEGPFTVFAPTDAAFAALPEGTVEALLADIPALTNILTYHVVGGKAMSSDLSDGQKIITVQGKKITVTINEDGVFIDNAKVTVADIEADNGVVHVIDAVLIPSALPSTVVDIVVDSEDHSTLEAAVVAAGLVETLQGDGPFTVFAPTDAAFAALPEGTVEALLADIPALTDILTYHVVGGKAMSTDLSDGQMIATVNGKEIEITISEEGVFINNAKVTVADIEADNGVVHVIDAVLLPPTITVVDIVVNSEDHTTLEAAVVAAGLVETLQGDGPFTVFAPTDAAFAALPEGTVEALLADIPALTDILTYHVVGGKAMSTDLSDGQMIATVNGKEIEITISEEGVFINNAKVTVADIEADNGVVHVIDAVLLPPTITVVDIVVNSEDHTTLEAAVVAAGLVETLQGDGPFTVFAPTDAAFAALPEGTVEALLADIPALTDILTYHVVGGKAMSSDLSDGQMIATVNGKEIEVTINEDGVFINNAKVTVADIEADNGVVHVIDAVLIPETLPATVVDIATSNDDFSILVQALTSEDLTIDFVGALTGEGPFTVFAPTNAAFVALLAELGATSLDDIETETLEAVLQMHVLAGKVMSTDLSEGLKAQTLLGQELTFSLEGGAKIIDPNGRVSNIVAVDIEAQNGVVHVIDTVILMDLTPTSVTNLEQISFDFYPNPANVYITVRTDEIGSSLRIMDISGKLMHAEQIWNSSQRVDLNGVKSGVYFISIEGEGKRAIQKLIVR
jgi:transforming growth factor-beta-induced protein